MNIVQRPQKQCRTLATLCYELSLKDMNFNSVTLLNWTMSFKSFLANLYRQLGSFQPDVV